MDVLFLALYAVVDVLSPASYAVDALSLASYEVTVDVLSQTSCTLVADVLSPASSGEAVASFVVHVAVDSPSCVDAEEHVAIRNSVAACEEDVDVAVVVLLVPLTMLLYF